MTTLDAATGSSTTTAPTPPPFSRALRIAAGACLIAAGLLNGLGQFIGSLLAPGDLAFSELIPWGADHPLAWGIEQTAIVVSSLFMPLGLLGVAHVSRFRAPVLTAIATPLVLVGMWGFANVLSTGYVTGTVAPTVLSVDQAVELNDGLGTHPGLLAVTLVPFLLGAFFGLILLSVAAWRSRSFPRPALALLVVFLLWDFGLPIGPVDLHVLLAIAWIWMGLHLLRMPDAVWSGARPATA
jgi:hypothetical protein